MSQSSTITRALTKKLKWQQSDQKPVSFRLHSFRQTLESAIQTEDLSTAIHTVPTGKTAKLYTVQYIGQRIRICQQVISTLHTCYVMQNQHLQNEMNVKNSALKLTTILHVSTF